MPWHKKNVGQLTTAFNQTVEAQKKTTKLGNWLKAASAIFGAAAIPAVIAASTNPFVGAPVVGVGAAIVAGFKLNKLQQQKNQQEMDRIEAEAAALAAAAETSAAEKRKAEELQATINALRTGLPDEVEAPRTARFRKQVPVPA